MPKKNKKETLKDYKCLMVEYDNRVFFTDLKHRKLLLEFSRVFKAILTEVNINEAEVHLDLESLVKSFCDPNYTADKTTAVKEVFDKKTKEIFNKLDKPSEIEDSIRKQFISGNEVVVQNFYKVWSEVHYPKVYNTIMKVKDKLEKDGWDIRRIGRGVYTAVKP